MSERLTPERIAEIHAPSLPNAYEGEYAKRLKLCITDLLSELAAVTKERDEMEGERDAWKQNAEEWEKRLMGTE